MTAPDPLREDEVEALARAMCDDDKARRHSAEYAQSWAESPEGYWRDHWRDKARAAILRLDEVRGK